MTTLTIKLPGPAKWKVNQGEKISAGYVIGEVKLGGEEKIIPLSKLLRVPPKKIGKCLLKKVGDKVKTGEPLAQKKTLFKKIAVKSIFDAKLAKIDEAGGNLILEEERGWQEFTSDVAGEVKKVSQDSLEIEFGGEVLEGIKGTGKKARGEIEFLGDKITVSDLSTNNQGKIICAKEARDVPLKKALALEVAGIVLTNIDNEDFANISCSKTWEIGDSCLLYLPLLIVGETDFTKIKNFQGKKAILDPEEKRLILCL